MGLAISLTWKISAYGPCNQFDMENKRLFKSRFTSINIQISRSLPEPFWKISIGAYFTVNTV